ncbi:hypothetical protein PMNALOAF_3259 [Methylobacterium adhaesivum]|uniref:DUF2336 domain-containing protein n=1 Tax=Methylobacterium adhaesivum TaxID=333297 RepID=A0ABT8BB32_9HYPH|nr:DUF2336 domain-containing protein [Methylobacterium adhaesivum]MDN3589108.1 DUF2336 domain-containing protein [Methylobacterium adhaesivum]GJD31994.1 hypothetical protein PMNALOAF_3259 [Methylobacterium adhaesivum]
MTIRQFLALTQHASAARRAEGAKALVRAFLSGHLTPDTAGQARATILALLDDPAPQVRRALAEASAASPAAPRALVVALAGDHADIAALVLKHSPVLSDADLVDGIAIGCETTRQAIAERRTLSYAVAGAMAEIAGPRALTALAANHGATITVGSLLRLLERHGDDAPLRDALLARADLPLEVRQACSDRVAEAMAHLAVESGWLTPARGERAGREARERATLSLSVGAPPPDVARLVGYLRRNGQLTAGLILRAILSGHMPFAEIALADLANLPPARVAGLMHEGGGAAYAALHRRAGLPAALLPAFGGALSAWREAGRGESTAHGAVLSCLMIERAITACETMPFADAQGVMALLTRFEAEAARDAAREQTRTPSEHPFLAPPATIDFPEATPVPLKPTPQPSQEAHASILDAEWREAREGVHSATSVRRTLDEAAAITGLRPPAPMRQVTAPVAKTATGALVETGRTDPVGLIFDALPHAMLAKFQAEREARAVADVRADANEARTETVAKEPETIPSDLVASYRADRPRVHLAA